MRRLLPLLLLALALPAVAGVPQTLTHQGRLLDGAGVPLEGTHNVTVRLFDAATGGSALWTESLATQFTNGHFSLLLGESSDFADAFDADGVWLELELEGSPPLTRAPLTSVPYALRADTSTHLSGGVVDATEIRVGGVTVIDAEGALVGAASWDTLTDIPEDLADGDDDALGDLACATGESLVFDGLAWACAPTAHEHDASDVTTGVFTVDRLPVGTSADTVAAGDHTHDAGAITTGVFDPARIPSLDAAKIGSGTLDPARIPSLDAAKIGSGTLDPARIPSLDAAKIGSGTFPVARLPVGTGATQVAAGNHSHTAAQVGALPASGGTLGGDLVISGDLRVEGLSFPLVRTLAGRAWLDNTLVDRTGSNGNYNNGALDTGGNYTNDTYLRLDLIPANVLASTDKLSVRVEWIRECLTADCDTYFVLTDGTRSISVGNWDNDGGTVAFSSSNAPSAWTSYTGQGGNVYRMIVDYTVQSGQVTSVAWHAQTTGSNVERWGNWESGVTLNPAAGLRLDVRRDNVDERVRHRLLRVEVHRQQ